MHRPAELPTLTGLRFFAAFAVVLGHYSQMGFFGPSAIEIDARPAVTFFFVLSGFILTYNYQAATFDRETTRSYLIARFARIYPVHLLGLVVALASFGLALASGQLQELLGWYAIKPGEAPAALSASLAAQLLLLTAWLPFASLNQPWNGPAWSISCEAFFYVLFPVLVCRLRTIRPQRLAIVVLILWMAQGLALVVLRQVIAPNRAGFLVSQFPATHLFEFVIGIAAAVWFSAGGRGALSAGLAPKALLAITTAAIAGLCITTPVSPGYYLLSPLFALAIVIIASGAGIARLLSSPLLVLLGEASFALYLLHVPIGNALRLIAAPNSTWGGVILVAVVAVSVGVFKLYEEPARKWIRRTSRPVASVART